MSVELIDSLASVFRAEESGVVLFLKITPKSAHTEFGGVVDVGEGKKALLLKLQAQPRDGEANAALTLFLSRAFSIAQKAVKLEKGQSSRFKTVRILGDAVQLEQALRALVS